jgi:hypothetical protein
LPDRVHCETVYLVGPGPENLHGPGQGEVLADENAHVAVKVHALVRLRGESVVLAFVLSEASARGFFELETVVKHHDRAVGVLGLDEA